MIIFEELYNLNRIVKKFIILLVDIFLLFISAYIVHSIQLEYFPPIGRSLLLYVLISNVIYLLIYFYYKNSSLINRYFDIDSIKALFVSTISLSIILYLISHYVDLRFFNFNFIFLHCLIFLLSIILSRIFIRNFYSILKNIDKSSENCAIFGAGDSGYQLINNSDFRAKYKVTHFIDEDKNRIGQYISNRKIISIQDLKKYSFKKCFFCAPSLSSFKQKEIQSIFQRNNIPLDFSYNTNLFNTLDNNFNYNLDIKKNSLTIKKFSQKKKVYKNKVIFITGGAGSIGGEICSQLHNLNPKKIIILDNNEYNLSRLKQSLLLLKNKHIIKTCLMDACNFKEVKLLFKKYKPHYIFHAAAYKHVDIVEENSDFSIKNNILGLNNLLKLSTLYNVKNFTFISTDKAVRPKNVMGQTKKIGEILLTYYSRKTNQKLNYNSVRFGNVIGSSGSFIQTLRKQLSKGGPITVTSKKATRYFMTITDAVNLVIESQIMNESGNTFVLKMGKPINIYKMVLGIIKKNNKKMKISIIGLRSGEKLHEELFENQLNVQKTKNPLILVEKNKNKLNQKKLNKFINNIENSLNLKKEINSFIKNN